MGTSERKAATVTLLVAVLASAAWFLFARGTAVSPGNAGSSAAGDAPERAGVEASAPSTEESARLAAGAPRSVAESPPPGVTGPRITGRVVDAKGQGIARAHVVTVSDTNSKMLFPSEAGKPGSVAREASAAEDGRFVVGVSGDAPFYTVLAEAPGYGM